MVRVRIQRFSVVLAFLLACAPAFAQQHQDRQGLGFSLAAIGAARPIPWKTGNPVWVPQWPLSSEKLEAVIQLVEEQLKLGHIEPSTSPWNTPIFVI